MMLGTITIVGNAPDEVQKLATERWEAKQAKNWAEADLLRKKLADAGWSMKDGKDGSTLESLRK